MAGDQTQGFHMRGLNSSPLPFLSFDSQFLLAQFYVNNFYFPHIFTCSSSEFNHRHLTSQGKASKPDSSVAELSLSRAVSTTSFSFLSPLGPVPLPSYQTDVPKVPLKTTQSSSIFFLASITCKTSVTVADKPNSFGKRKKEAQLAKNEFS